MKKNIFIVILMVAVSLLDGSSLFGKSKSKKSDLLKFLSGEIIIPYENHINLKEGTFETWVAAAHKPGENLNLPTETGATVLGLMQTASYCGFRRKGFNRDIDPARIVFSTNQLAEGETEDFYALFSFLSRKYSDKITLSHTGCSLLHDLKWKQMKWHYLALTWKPLKDDQYEVNIYNDGKKIVTHKFTMNPQILANDNNNVIVFGGIYPNFVAFNEIRISSNAKTETEIAKQNRKSFKKEKTTLFLLNSSGLKKLKKVKAKIVEGPYTRHYTYPANFKLSQKGIILGYYKFIRGKFGQAIKLSDIE
jgi:hypothetical protein